MKCTSPVPANAHWTHRDRHVCGQRCNSNLGRQLNRLIKKGGDLAIPRPAPMPDPRTDPAPRVFRTLSVPAASGLRYDFDGSTPRPGDAVERDGEVTVYGWIRVDELPRVPEYAPHGFFVAEHSSGHHLLQAATRDGRPERMLLGEFDPTGGQRHGPFEVQGRVLEWVTEFISDVTPDGREFTWEAPVCVALPPSTPESSGPWPGPHWPTSDGACRLRLHGTPAESACRRRRSNGSTQSRSSSGTGGSADCAIGTSIANCAGRIPPRRASTTSFRWSPEAPTAGRTRSWRTGSATYGRVPGPTVRSSSLARNALAALQASIALGDGGAHPGRCTWTAARGSGQRREPKSEPYLVSEPA
ncbi:hypothetical protein SAMN05660199_01168 [Klenkia soli]|uniref:Uncharacterized protein n=1 Tax=Klenkia soli TaxID=1052260 RepID=A0A1H0G8M0_9ACTN|nr:hypothetical protein SAMN05660199_01168 [Klenkia soli]